MLPRGTRRMRGRLAPIRVTRHAVWIHRLPNWLRRPCSRWPRQGVCDPSQAGRGGDRGETGAVLGEIYPGGPVPGRRRTRGRGSGPGSSGHHGQPLPEAFQTPVRPTGPTRPEPPTTRGKTARLVGLGATAARPGLPWLIHEYRQRKLPMHLPTKAAGYRNWAGTGPTGFGPRGPAAPAGATAAAVELAISDVHERRSGR